MDQVQQEETCLLEQTTTVIFESPVTARRRRMEIRRFKRISGPSACSRGLSLVQQGTFKRTPFRTSSICSICYHSNDAKGDADMFYTSRPVDEQKPTCSSTVFSDFQVSGSLGERDVLLRGNGLVRSKSFPQCMHAGRCSLHIRKTARDSLVMDVGGHFTGLNTESQRHSAMDKPVEVSCLSPKTNSKTDLDTTKEILLADVVSDDMVTPCTPGTGSSADGKREGYESFEGSSCRDLGVSVRTPDPGTKRPAVHAEGIFSKVLTSSSDGAEKRILGRCPLSGKVLVCGRRREMEDTVVLAPYFTRIPFAGVSGGVENSCDLHFFGVYDGHAGAQASIFCAERLHHALTEELSGSQVMEDKEDDSEWERVMVSCFMKVDNEVGGICPSGMCDNVDSSAVCCKNAVAPENVGTTAVVAVLSPSRIVVANCGDSRAVLSRGGVAIPLSKDHKPEREDETRRIEAAGGRVIYWDGYRVAGLLALSRALGDRYLKKYVISKPDVLCMPRANDDECLILASDGLWDVISNDTACDVARRCLALARRRHKHRVSLSGEDSACAQVAALLVKLAYGRGSKDNISVVVIDLKSKPL